MGNCSITIHAIGSHHNQDNHHDLNKMAARFVDELKAAGHNITHAHIHHGGAEDLLPGSGGPTRTGAFGALAAAVAAALVAAVTLFHPVTARAADMTPKPLVKTAPVVVAGYPFYGFLDAGVGASTTRSELTLQGVDILGNQPKQYPTGLLVGGGVGVDANTAIGGISAEARLHYNFDRASFGCGPLIGCQGYAKNSLLAQEMVYWAPFTTTPLAWTGWGWTQGLNILFGGGAAQRNVDACLFTAGGVPSVQALSDGTACDTKWLMGWDAGLKITAPLSADGRWKMRITADYINYNQAAVHKDSVVFATPMSGSFQMLHELIALAGIQYNFSF